MNDYSACCHRPLRLLPRSVLLLFGVVPALVAIPLYAQVPDVGDSGCVLYCNDDDGGSSGDPDSNDHSVEVTATATEIEGTVTVSEPGVGEYTVTQGLVLRAGMKIKTGKGSKVVLSIDGGAAKIVINANSEFELETAKSSQFYLLKGLIRFWAGVTGERYIRTVTAVAGVRGTIFDVEVEEDDTTIVTVHEGSVDVTDHMGETTLLTAGKTITVSPPDDPGPGVSGGSSGTSLDLDCFCGYEYSDTSLTLFAARVENNRGSGSSGTLRLKLWATEEPYTGGTIRGYILGEYTFTSVLNARSYFEDIERSVAFRRPPDGFYYVTLTLTEYDGQDYIMDYETFPTRLKIGEVTLNAAERVSTVDYLQPESVSGVRFVKGAPAASAVGFSLGLTRDNGINYVSAARVSEAVEILGAITPAPEHVSRVVDVYLVDRLNGKFHMLTRDGSFVRWDGRVPNLVPARTNVFLTQELVLEIFSGRLGVVGDHRIFMGYMVDGQLYYTPKALQFEVFD